MLEGADAAGGSGSRRGDRKVPLRKNFDTHLRLWFHGGTRAFPLLMRLPLSVSLHIPFMELVSAGGSADRLADRSPDRQGDGSMDRLIDERMGIDRWMEIKRKMYGRAAAERNGPDPSPIATVPDAGRRPRPATRNAWWM
jgi:hypothetical protein